MIQGRYVKRNHLLGFAEELGHDIESIIDGREEDSYNEEIELCDGN